MVLRGGPDSIPGGGRSGTGSESPSLLCKEVSLVAPGWMVQCWPKISCNTCCCNAKVTLRSLSIGRDWTIVLSSFTWSCVVGLSCCELGSSGDGEKQT